MNPKDRLHQERIASDARSIREAAKVVRALLATPFARVVRMKPAEWKDLVARGQRRLGNKHEAGRVRAAALRIGKDHQREMRL